MTSKILVRSQRSYFLACVQSIALRYSPTDGFIIAIIDVDVVTSNKTESKMRLGNSTCACKGFRLEVVNIYVIQYVLVIGNYSLNWFEIL